MMCSYVDKLEKICAGLEGEKRILEEQLSECGQKLASQDNLILDLSGQLQDAKGMLFSREERLQSALKDERIKRSDLMIGIVDLKNRIERLESFMESIGACTECCQDPCRCERRVVVPDV